MSRYIDAEKLIAKLTKMQFELNAAYRKPQSDSIVRAISLEYDDVISLVTSLQQEQPHFADASKMERLNVDILLDWSMRFAPDIRDAIEATAYHFWDLAIYSRKELPESGGSEKPNNLSSEWTEEDERTRWNLCSLLTNLRVGKKIEESTFKKYYSWLKIIHIKPRKTRKSEQSEADLEKEIIKYKVPFTDESKYLNETTLDAIAHHFYELGQSTMRERITNPEYNQKVIEKMKSEYPEDELNQEKK